MAQLSPATTKRDKAWSGQSGPLAGAKVAADTDAVVWLASQLGADRAATRQELEKLAVHAGAGGRVNVEMARACVGDLGGFSLDDALFSATDGEVAKAARALE